MENNYTVYMHIFPNNKVYIGITYRKPLDRWNDKYRGCPKMKRAIKKYGWENIEHKILYEHLTKEEAEQKEIELIKKYNSTNDDYGYNIANGGMHKGKCSEETKKKISEIKKGHQVSLEVREKISKGCKGKIAWNKGIPMSNETKNKLSKSLKGKTAWNKGKKMSEETRKKLSIKHKGRPSPRKGVVLSLETREKISKSMKKTKKVDRDNNKTEYNVANAIFG